MNHLFTVVSMLLAFCLLTSAQLSGNQLPLMQSLDNSSLNVLGTGIIPFYAYNSTNITFTAYSIGANATQALSLLNNSILNITNGLANFSDVLVQNSSMLSYFPIYSSADVTGLSQISGVGASIDYILTVPANETMRIMDLLLSSGARISGLSLMPDRDSERLAEAAAFQLAYDDAFNRASAALRPIGRCVTNASSIVILSPQLFPSFYTRRDNLGMPFAPNQDRIFVPQSSLSFIQEQRPGVRPALQQESSGDVGQQLLGLSAPLISQRDEIAVYLLVSFLSELCNVSAINVTANVTSGNATAAGNVTAAGNASAAGNATASGNATSSSGSSSSSSSGSASESGSSASASGSGSSASASGSGSSASASGSGSSASASGSGSGSGSGTARRRYVE